MIAQGRGGRIIGEPSMPLPFFFFCVAHFGLAIIVLGACSGTGKQGQASLSAYSASKFSVRGLTQAAGESRSSSPPGFDAVRILKHVWTDSALEFGSYGITVNAYAPGPVKTPMCM